ncbi:MAG TPA: alpha-1,2-fucosyltransferase [Trichocoleus sp.]|jgi:hypothetical protein
MLVIAAKSGRLGNRLLLFANFIAFAIEHQLSVLNPAFEEYAAFFESTAQDLFCAYPQQRFKLRGSSFLRKRYYRWVEQIAKAQKSPTITISREKPFNWSNSSIALQAQKQPISLFKGWLFRDGWFMEDLGILHQHHQAICAYFTPVKKHQSNVESLISQARDQCDLLIGVHIRQGDYQQHQNSRYFYSTQQYIQVMESIVEQFSDRKVGFLVCSNVSQNQALFGHLNCIWGNDHIIEDLYAFAQCDYIVGAPSSYTMWAAFYGQKPLYMIRAIDHQLTIADFIYSYQWRGVFHQHQDWGQAYWEWTH